MTPEPTETPGEPTTAQRLAQHPRWEWREGVLIGGDGELAGWRVMLVEDWGTTLTRNGQSWAVGAGRLPALALVPDLADDATAGIVLGMVRAWAAKVDGLVEIHAGTKQAVVVVSFEEHGAPWATRIRRLGETVGDAAGECMIACWARAAEGDGR